MSSMSNYCNNNTEHHGNNEKQKTAMSLLVAESLRYQWNQAYHWGSSDFLVDIDCPMTIKWIEIDLDYDSI